MLFQQSTWQPDIVRSPGHKRVSLKSLFKKKKESDKVSDLASPHLRVSGEKKTTHSTKAHTRTKIVKHSKVKVGGLIEVFFPKKEKKSGLSKDCS